MHTPNIHALSGIRTHDLSVRASEGSSCLTPRGYCDRSTRCSDHNSVTTEDIKAVRTNRSLQMIGAEYAFRESERCEKR
jgi:hypothetical protein